MCRFNTKLFNSPTLPDLNDFAIQLTSLTGQTFVEEELNEIGRNVTGIERMLNFRFGLRAKDDTLPKRWFEEALTEGPFAGEKIERKEFDGMKARFYALTGLNAEGTPATEWHEKLSRLITGFAVRVELPKPLPGAPEQILVIDETVGDVTALRRALLRKLPEAAADLNDSSWNIAVNGNMVLSGEGTAHIASGDRVTLVPIIAGG
jgi:aldehyde:ferredoxin oxidoreductase